MADSKAPDGPNVVLTVDGERIPLNRFATEVVAGGVTGMIKGLRGVEEPKKIVLEIELP